MATVRITLLTADGCQYCGHARDVLARMTGASPLEVEELSIHSPEGSRRALQDAIAFPPGIYVNGTLFGYGRLSEAKLKRRLTELSQS